MIVAVPLETSEGLDSQMCEHFGSSPLYAFCDTGSGRLQIVDNSNSGHEHGQCSPINDFSRHNVEAVLCKGIGRRAIQKLKMSGIEVFIAEELSTLSQALGSLKSGTMHAVQDQDACQGHNCH
ncbi:MAG: dinitrogenase iron-molybdenum cofactor biosynthesis protein [Chlorobium sp.]|nr:dinitrogenase iron-molybdenum cofactor biosynthesis protein [Chlorobium sp.]MCW8816167.1 dinitrogenase iron-molybdenum cofactor biosynthesis protein [Chlorobium sp.]MCW8819808.1 hypothetical protein [Ignavibacteriaceae bacterium]